MVCHMVQLRWSVGYSGMQHFVVRCCRMMITNSEFPGTMAKLPKYVGEISKHPNRMCFAVALWDSLLQVAVIDHILLPAGIPNNQWRYLICTRFDFLVALILWWSAFLIFWHRNYPGSIFICEAKCCPW